MTAGHVKPVIPFRKILWFLFWLRYRFSSARRKDEKKVKRKHRRDRERGKRKSWTVKKKNCEAKRRAEQKRWNLKWPKEYEIEEKFEGIRNKNIYKRGKEKRESTFNFFLRVEWNIYNYVTILIIFIYFSTLSLQF